MKEKLRVLVTGAAGRIGKRFVEYADHRYEFRLAVHHREKLGHSVWDDIIEIDFADREACREACDGIDVLLHLGGTPSPAAPFYDGVLESNIIGTYNMFRAAKDSGCSRIVYGSSIQAVDGHPLDSVIRSEDPVKPTCLYGVSKCFGEALAYYFAYSEDISCIAVRIGHWGGNPGWDDRKHNARYLSSYISERDLCHLFVRCIETSDVKFALVHGQSDNRFKRLDLSSAREQLDYKPCDDAFRMFDVNLEYLDRWQDERPDAEAEPANDCSEEGLGL